MVLLSLSSFFWMVKKIAASPRRSPLSVTHEFPGRFRSVRELDRIGVHLSVATYLGRWRYPPPQATNIAGKLENPPAMDGIYQEKWEDFLWLCYFTGGFLAGKITDPQKV